MTRSRAAPQAFSQLRDATAYRVATTKNRATGVGLPFSDFLAAEHLDRLPPVHSAVGKAQFSWPVFFDFLRISHLNSAAEIRAKARWGGEFTGKFRAKLRWVREKKLVFSSVGCHWLGQCLRTLRGEMPGAQITGKASGTPFVRFLPRGAFGSSPAVLARRRGDAGGIFGAPVSC